MSGHRHGTTRGVIAALLACTLGCAGDSTVVELLMGSSEVGGDVVSTVDGTPITVADVTRIVGATGLSAADALARLQEQRLLAREAERRGFGDHAEVREVTRRALVQTLLARDIESEPVPEAAIRKRYEEKKATFVHGERRYSMHVLTKFKDDAGESEREMAREFLQEVIERYSAGDPAKVLSEALALNGKPGIPFEVLAERLPPTEHEGKYVKAYEDALFALDAPGPVPEIIETNYGLHAVYLNRIEPALDITLSEATPGLRDELAEEQRRARTKAWLEHRRLVERVELDQAALDLISELRL